MKLDLMTSGLPLHAAQQLARHAADTGHAGLVVTEAGRTAYLSCAAAALAADIDLLTGIAVAFPRSPMVTAQIAWELADVTDGRFRLGLGTQVRAHIERFDLSGHADRPELLNFAQKVDPRTIVLTHGDPEARNWFFDELLDYSPKTIIIDPVPGESTEL